MLERELKKIVVEIADEVERKVKQERKKNFKKFGETLFKGADGTPTQYIDKVAEDTIFELVGKKVSILSEEAGFSKGESKYVFIVDPIDGTRNAVRGIPFYCFSIAIGQKSLNDVTYALVRNIPTGDTFIAEKENGAFLNGQRIHVDPNISDPVFSLVLGGSGNENTWRFVNMNSIRSLGAAALEMCLVASGAIHAYYMGRESLRVTDFAAGSLIVREAGGEVYTTSGEILNVKLSLDERSSVLAVASPEIRGLLI